MARILACEGVVTRSFMQHGILRLQNYREGLFFFESMDEGCGNRIGRKHALTAEALKGPLP